MYISLRSSSINALINLGRESILRNLREAESKFNFAEEELAIARENFENAKLRSEQIRNEGVNLSLQASKLVLNSINEDIKRLKSSNLALIKFEEEKSVAEMCQRLSQSALLKATDKINKKMNYSLHRKFITQNIEKLSSTIIIQN